MYEIEQIIDQMDPRIRDFYHDGTTDYMATILSFMGTTKKPRYLVYADRNGHVYGLAAIQGHFGPRMIRDHFKVGHFKVTHQDTK